MVTERFVIIKTLLQSEAKGIYRCSLYTKYSYNLFLYMFVV